MGAGLVWLQVILKINTTDVAALMIALHTAGQFYPTLQEFYGADIHFEEQLHLAFALGFK